MLASCFILVGLSYYLLNLFSGMVAVPRTPVEEKDDRGELFLPLEEEITWMETSLDGRFLAAVARGREASHWLLVLDLENGGRVVWSRQVGGDRARWAGGSLTLVFEDGGDILALDLERDPPTPAELTSGPEYDEDPVPSPDGRHVLWRASAGSGRGGELRVMRLDGGEKRILGPGEEPTAWDPTGTRLICMVPLDGSAVGESGKPLLQEVDIQTGTCVDRYPCREEARYLWWPEPGAFLYVAPYTRGEETRAVWFEVKPSGEEEKKASTDGVDADFSPQLFCPERGGPRLAYRGLKGLEILDIRRWVIIRYPHAGMTGAPLTWRESAGEIMWWEPGGIYRLSLD